jgi:hypothetical protein
MYYGGDAKDYVSNLNTLFHSFMDEFLKPLDKGHSELKICLTWYGWEALHGYEVRKGKGWKFDNAIIFNNLSFLRRFHETMSFSLLVQKSQLRMQ